LGVKCNFIINFKTIYPGFYAGTGEKAYPKEAGFLKRMGWNFEQLP